jgi:hypothetical protein
MSRLSIVPITDKYPNNLRTEMPHDSTIDQFRKFIQFCTKKLGLSKLPRIEWYANGDAGSDHHSFGSFHNGDQTIRIGITNRHPLDIMRTLAHELTHYKQWQEGKITDRSGETGSPIENEANATAGIIMRDWGQQHPHMFKEEPITEALQESGTRVIDRILDDLRNHPDYIDSAIDQIAYAVFREPELVDKHRAILLKAVDGRKPSIMRYLLGLLKSEKVSLENALFVVSPAVRALKMLGLDWPELDVLQRSIDAERSNITEGATGSKLSHRDPVERWIAVFKASTHPRFRGKTPEQRERMARAAQYRAVQDKKPITNEDWRKWAAGDQDEMDLYDPRSGERVSRRPAAPKEREPKLKEPSKEYRGRWTDQGRFGWWYISKHMQERLDQREIDWHEAMETIAGAYHDHRDEINRIPLDRPFMIRSSRKLALILAKSRTPAGKIGIALLTAWPRAKSPPASVGDRVFWPKADLSTLVREASDLTSNRKVEEFLGSLSADDVGVGDVGPYRIHYEGFSEWCQQDAMGRCRLPATDPRHLPSYEAVYDEVLADFIKREGGRKPLASGFAGDWEYPVLYAIFSRPRAKKLAEDAAPLDKPTPSVAELARKHQVDEQGSPSSDDYIDDDLLDDALGMLKANISDGLRFMINYGITLKHIPAARPVIDKKKSMVIKHILKKFNSVMVKDIPEGRLAVELDDLQGSVDDLIELGVSWPELDTIKEGLRSARAASDSSTVAENFADGKGPGRPGDSQRHGIPKGATIAQLEKHAKRPGRAGQLARWQLNMRRGKAKASR